MTAYLVLGASGFLGSHVHAAINRSNEVPDIVAVSRRPPRLAMSHDSSWVPLDLSTVSVQDLVVLIEAARPRAVINCVGRTSGTAEELWDLNTTFVDKLVQALSQSGPTPLVHLGSAAEYGPHQQNVPIKETAATRPVSNYGRSKLAATRKIMYAAESGDISATVLRVFNPVGARAPSDSLTGCTARELRLALANGRHTITTGPLDSYRDFVAASDVGDVALATARLKGKDPVLNVGRGAAVSCRAIVKLLADVAGYEGEIIEAGIGSGRSDEVPWQQADVALLEGDLGWKPSTPLADALEELWVEGAPRAHNVQLAEDPFTDNRGWWES